MMLQEFVKDYTGRDSICIFRSYYRKVASTCISCSTHPAELGEGQVQLQEDSLG